jgi:hypothetical protein
MKPSHKTNLIFGIIVIFYAVYAGIYIFKTSFIVNGVRYFVLFDDAMISMKYAKNFAQGLGLVWNPGEYVEGFSNPLWVFFMSIFHVFPIPANLMSLPIQISGAVFLAATLFVVKKIGDLVSNSPYTGLIAATLTAFYVQLNTWSLLGMEVSLAALLTTLAGYMAIKAVKTESRFSPAIYLLTGFSTLLRIDLAVAYLGIWAYLVLFDSQNRMKHLAWGFFSLALFLGAQTAARRLYYGEWLPNTYYLKVSGVSMAIKLKAGIFFLTQFLWRWNPALFWLPFVFTAAKFLEARNKGLRARQALDTISPFIPMLLILVLYCGYSVYVGGDSWEKHGGANRFISTGLPLYFSATACAATWLVEKVRGRAAGETDLGQLDTLALLGVSAFALIGLVDLRSVADPEQPGHWIIANLIPLVVIIGLTSSLALPKRKQNFAVIASIGFMVIYLVTEALIRRSNAAGDLLGPAGWVNTLKTVAKVFAGLKAPMLWMPLSFAVFILRNKDKKWWFVTFGLFLLGLVTNIAYGSVFTSIQGGASNLLTSFIPAGVIVLAYLPVSSQRVQNASKSGFAGALAAIFLAAYLVNVNALRDMSSLNVWFLKERHIFIEGSERMVNISLVLNRIGDENAQVAVVTAGIIPYFSEMRFIDQLGKCDPVISRTAMLAQKDMLPGDYRAGHMKWDPSYSLGYLQPDIVAQLFNGYHNPDNLQHLAGYRAVTINKLPFYIRNDSDLIRWEEVPKGRPAWNPKP